MACSFIVPVGSDVTSWGSYETRYPMQLKLELSRFKQNLNCQRYWCPCPTSAGHVFIPLPAVVFLVGEMSTGVFSNPSGTSLTAFITTVNLKHFSMRTTFWLTSGRIVCFLAYVVGKSKPF